MLWPTSSDSGFTVTPARTAIELTSAAALLRAYAKVLPVEYALPEVNLALAALDQKQELWLWFLIGVIALLCGEV